MLNGPPSEHQLQEVLRVETLFDRAGSLMDDMEQHIRDMDGASRGFDSLVGAPPSSFLPVKRSSSLSNNPRPPS